jgi:succinate dehydrogenase hydrophobic anchor subunit
MSLATYFFLVTDLPWQGLSLTHGIPTALALLTILAGTQMNTSRIDTLKVLAILSGATYAVFAQLFTPLLFAALFAYLPVICRDLNKQKNFNLDTAVLFKFWVCGYFITMLIHNLLGFLLRAEDKTSELQDGVSSRFTQSFTGLLRVVYMQVVVNPTTSPLRFIGILMLMLILGYFMHGKFTKPKKYEINLRTFDTPFVYISIWLLLMGGHDGHGWVGNLFWILPLLLIFQMYSHRLFSSKV